MPGRLDSESSEGTNALIQQGAKLVGNARDIVEDLQYLLPQRFLKGVPQQAKTEGVSSVPAGALNDVQKKILSILEAEPVGIDEILRLTGIAAPEVAGNLLVLEMQGLVQQHPGKNFARVYANK